MHGRTACEQPSCALGLIASVLSLALAAAPEAAKADPPATTLGTLTAIAGQRTLSLGFTLRPGQAQQLTDVRVLRRASPKDGFALVESTATLDFVDRDGFGLLIGGVDGLTIAEGVTNGAAAARVTFSVARPLAYGDEVCVTVRTEDGRAHTLTTAASAALFMVGAGRATSAPTIDLADTATGTAVVEARLKACTAALARARRTTSRRAALPAAAPTPRRAEARPVTP